MLDKKRKKKDAYMHGTRIVVVPIRKDIVDKVNKRILREVEPMTFVSVARKLMEQWVNKELYDKDGNLL